MTAATATATVPSRAWMEPTPRIAAWTRSSSTSQRDWAALSDRQPQLAETGKAYLQQLSVTLSRGSVDAADQCQRSSGAFLTEQHPQGPGWPQNSRRQVGADKGGQGPRPGRGG